MSTDFVSEFLRDKTGRAQAIVAGRASAALVAALRARGIGAQPVLMPANICYLVAWAVLQSGNIPHLVDVDPATGNISLETLSQVQVESPAALVVCHMYGLGAPIAAIAEWARARGIFLIEDAALALSATVDGRPAGAWGDVALYSFGAGKIVDAGNGGAIGCDDAGLAQKIGNELDALPLWTDRIATLWEQWTELYWVTHRHEKANPQLASLYPALVKIFGDITRYRLPASHWDAFPELLGTLENNLRHRAEMTRWYDEYFRFAQVRTLQRPAGSILWRYPLLVARADRDALLEKFWENDVRATCWYPSLVPMLGALNPGIAQPPTPGADELGTTIVNLPVDATADEETVKRTAEIVQTYFREKRMADSG